MNLTKLQKLEKAALKRLKTVNDETFKTPDNWSDFAKLLQIRSGGDIVTFNPYHYQLKLVELMNQRSTIIVKGRQLGISELCLSWILFNACKSEGFLALVFSRTQTDSSLLARRMKRMIASLGLKTTTENVSDIELRGRGRVLFRNSSANSARGIDSVSVAFLDEFSFIENDKEVFNALIPALQATGEKARLIVNSTPNSKQNYYWDLLSQNNGDKNVEEICKKVSSGDIEPFQYWIDEGNWNKVILHWRSHPIYGADPNFLEKIHLEKKLSWETIEQEYNLSFSESEQAYFAYDTVQTCIGNANQDYKKEAVYIAGLDVAGAGNDYCVLTLIECLGEQSTTFVAYRKRQETTESNLFHISEVLRKYKPRLTCIETNGIGQVFIEQLSRTLPYLRFENIKTTQQSKIVMLSRLNFALEKQLLQFDGKSPLVNELLNFKKAGEKLEAGSGHHDDCVLSLSFALVGLSQLHLI